MTLGMTLGMTNTNVKILFLGEKRVRYKRNIGFILAFWGAKYGVL